MLKVSVFLRSPEVTDNMLSPFSVLKILIGKSSTPSTSTPSIVDLSVSELMECLQQDLH